MRASTEVGRLAAALALGLQEDCVVVEDVHNAQRALFEAGPSPTGETFVQRFRAQRPETFPEPSPNRLKQISNLLKSPTQEPVRVAFYLRVCPGESAKRLMRRLVERARALRMVPVETYIDQDVHTLASFQKRAELGRLLVNPGRFKAVLTLNMTHLAGSLEHLTKILVKLGNEGVHLVTVEEGMDTRTKKDAALFDLGRLMALLETQRKGAAVRRGQAKRKAKGLPPGGKRTFIDFKKVDHLLSLGLSYTEVCQALKTTPETMTRHLRERQRRLREHEALFGRPPVLVFPLLDSLAVGKDQP